MSRGKRRYVICLSNDGYRASLEARKVYLTLADRAAEAHGLLRVVDESGQDYLYPRARFARIRLPQNVERALSAVA